MIIKSLIWLSILFSSVGLDSLALRVDQSVMTEQNGGSRIVIAATEEFTLPEITIRPTVVDFAPKPMANAKNWILTDIETGTVFANQNEKQRVPIASTTKIMTAVVVLENYELDEVVTTSDVAANQIGASIFLRPGETVTVHNLLKAMLIRSGNDTAYALAEHMNVEGETGIQKFVDKMNMKATELGMADSNYSDPAGLNTEGYSSARDLAIITKYALKYDVFREIVKTPEAVIKNTDGTIWHELKNSNRLVNEYAYPGAIGIKTGYMPEAGHVLVGAAIRDGHTLISIVINTYEDTPNASADESRRLLDWGFSYINWNS